MVTTCSVESVECDVNKRMFDNYPNIRRFLDGVWPDHPGVEIIHEDMDVG